MRSFCLLFLMLAALAHAQSTDTECVQGFNGADLSTTNSWSNPKTRDNRIDQLAMCNQWKTTCCAAIHDAEIGDGFKHLVDVADKCLQTANTQNPQIHEYFCLFCHPRHIDFMECCDNVTYVSGGANSGEVFKCGNVGATGVRNATPYAAGPNSTCTSKQVNTIRICQSFADHLWVPHETKKELKTGEDLCGFSVWTGAGGYFPTGSDLDPNTQCGPTGVSGKDRAICYKNPNEIVMWGDVDGSTGDDPVLPGQMWGSASEFFRDIRPPLLDQFLIEVVPDAEGRCFGEDTSAAGAVAPSAAVLASTAAVAAVLSLWLWRH